MMVVADMKTLKVLATPAIAQVLTPRNMTPAPVLLQFKWRRNADHREKHRRKMEHSRHCPDRTGRAHHDVRSEDAPHLPPGGRVWRSGGQIRREAGTSGGLARQLSRLGGR